MDWLEMGDSLREKALSNAQKRRDLSEIPILLKEAREIHADQPVRLAKLQVVHGQVNYADRLYGEAIRDFIIAERLLKYELGCKDHPFITANSFYWLKASLMQGDDLAMSVRLIAKLRQSEFTTRSQRRTVAFLEAFGRPGCRFLDWLTYTDGNRLVTWLSRIGPVP